LRYHSWQRDTPRAPFDTCSPNLIQIRKYLEDRWGLWNLGCYGRRPIRGGTAWSSHAFGAAHDYSYRRDGNHPNAPSRDTVENEVIPWLIEHHEVLGIQRIHDYWAKRYWEVGRGWIGRPPGAVNDHLHLEVTPDTWGYASPISERIVEGLPAQTTQPAFVDGPRYPGHVTKRGSSAKSRVKLIQRELKMLGYKVGPVDGIFGPMTEGAVKTFQSDQHLTVDGLVGPNTWKALFN